MLRFVLVHGAWQYGEVWESVKTALEALGHEVHTPTALGLREGDSLDVGLDESVASIIDYITDHDLTDIVLVGHSWGGCLIAKTAEAVPERIKRLVFQNAFVPLDGDCVLDNVPPFFRPALEANAAERGDGGTLLPFEVWRDGFMNDADFETAKRTHEHLRPQPHRTFVEPMDLKRFYELQIPKSYVNATEDNGILQGEWGWHPRMSNRLGYFRLVQLPGSHGVMFTNPTLLASKLVEAGRD